MLITCKHDLQHGNPQGEGFVCGTENNSHCVCWCESRVIPCGEEESQKHEAHLNRKYYEHDYNQAKLIQINIWIGESITERCVDDHQEHTAADSTKWRLLPFKPVLDVPSDNLSNNKRDYNSHKQL